MNIEIIKSKDNYSPNAVKNRLIRIEKILQQLMQSLGSETQKNITIGENNNLLDKLSQPSIGIGGIAQINDLNRTVTNASQSPITNQKDNKNNLLLSRGQMMAELAMAIMRANQRNS